jgi:hypothetical protein
MRLSQEKWFILRVPAVLSDLERLTQADGYLAAGFLTYESGAAFGLRTLPGTTVVPLVWFAGFPSNA